MIVTERLAERPGDPAACATGGVGARFCTAGAALGVTDAFRSARGATVGGHHSDLASAAPGRAGSLRRGPLAACSTRSSAQLLTDHGLIVEMVANPTLVFLKQFREPRAPSRPATRRSSRPRSPSSQRATYEELDPSHFRSGRGLGEPSDRHGARHRPANEQPQLAFRASSTSTSCSASRSGGRADD